jgi:hypothetical protein
MKRHDPTSLPDTRVDLHKTHSRTDGQDKRTIFWLSGLAGTGKSTIARTIAETQSQRGRLGSASSSCAAVEMSIMLASL